MSVPNFGQLFMQSKAEPLTYNGKTLIMSGRHPAKLGDRFLVTIESTNSPYPQGIGIAEGIELFGTRVKKAVVWEYYSVPPEARDIERSRLPFSFEVVCRNKKGLLHFYNMAEYQGRQEWWTGGSAMIATDIAEGSRYACNDFEVDDDFDDLVFTVVKMVGI